MRKIILTILAIIFLVLGIIGLIFPIIPQVPFFAVSAILFSIVSTRFRTWMTGTKVYQKYLKKYYEKYGF